MSTHREHETLGFRAAPRLHSHRTHDGGANRYVVFAAGFVLALLLTALFS